MANNNNLKPEDQALILKELGKARHALLLLNAAVLRVEAAIRKNDAANSVLAMGDITERLPTLVDSSYAVFTRLASYSGRRLVFRITNVRGNAAQMISQSQVY